MKADTLFAAIIKTENGIFRDMRADYDIARATYNFFHAWASSYYEVEIIKVWKVKYL